MPCSVSSTTSKTTGTTSRLRMVDVNRPPITAMAMGERKLGSAAPRPMAIGSMPAAMAMVVMMIGRALVACVQQRLEPGQAVVAPCHDRVLHEQDGILGRDAHE